jgi:hypothetical protein
MKIRYLLIGVIVLFIVGLLTTSSYAKIDSKTCIGMWLFDDGAGDTAKDSSGNKNDGKLMNGPKWVNGKFGKALEFNGANSYVQIPDSASLNTPEKQVTMSAWISPTKAIQQLVIEKYTAAGGYEIELSAGSAIQGALCVAGAWVGWFGTKAVNLNEWSCVACTYNAGDGKMKLYINGNMVEQFSVNGNITPCVGDPINIGTWNGAAGYWFNGMIDEVAIFNVALADADIQNLADKGLKESLAVDVSGKLTTTWSNIKTR